MKWTICLPALFLGACTTSAPVHEAMIPPASLASLSGQSAISCRFEKSHGEASTAMTPTDWYFMRQPNRTETRDLASRQGELWEKDDSGHMTLTRLFHAERVALDYTSGDLAISEHYVPWARVWTIVDTAEFGKTLLLGREESLNGVKIQHYQGKPGNTIGEMDWLPTLNLPYRMVTQTGHDTDVLQLRECLPVAQASVLPITAKELQGYRHIDSVDMGDMESDPVVQRIMQLGGEAHHH